MRIVVVGGSGLIGSELVRLLRRRGHEVVSASRSAGVDATTNNGLAAVLTGSDVVIDVSNTTSSEGAGAIEFFTAVAKNLAVEEMKAGVMHHIALSVVGAEQVDSPYFRGKVAQEAIIKASEVPYTIVRSTQFFELVERLLKSAFAGNVLRLPPASIRPVASQDVVDTLAVIAENAPLNTTIELAGPDIFPLSEFARLMMSTREDRREIISDPQARYFGAVLKPEALLPGPGAQITPLAFGDWLRQRISPD